MMSKLLVWHNLGIRSCWEGQEIEDHARPCIIFFVDTLLLAQQVTCVRYLLLVTISRSVIISTYIFQL